jgi:hypothetical protein
LLDGHSLYGVRDRETIDSELRLIAAVRWSIRENGGEPPTRRRTARRTKRTP